MDFLDIEVNRNFVIKCIIVCAILIVIYLALTMSSLLMFKSYELEEDTIVDPERMMLNTHIDKLEHSGKKVEISGWAYKEGEPITTVNSNYVLHSQETGKMYLMRTQMEDNINISEEEHKKAGLHSQCLLFGLPKGRYDIYVLYKNDDENILTNTLIYVDI